MIHLLLAEGFEEIEALSVVDMARRAGLEVQTVSTAEEKNVKGAHGILVSADAMLSETLLEESDMIVLPGGLPGATNLYENQLVVTALKSQYEKGKPLAAICAAPYILGELGLLKGKKATCYPGFESHLQGAVYTAKIVERDGNIITGKGPAAAFAFAAEIVEFLAGKDVRTQVEKGMLIQK